MKLTNYGNWHCAECPQCQNGQHQSPIHITRFQEGGQRPLSFAYQPLIVKAVDTGHGINFEDQTGNSSIVYDGVRYTLMQFHFHQPGEHQIDGQSYAMELHLVHWHAERGFLVVAVLIQSDHHIEPVADTAYAHLWECYNASDGGSFSCPVSDLLPTSHDYYTYQGSLTTPPCSENVRWAIMAESVALSRTHFTVSGTWYTGNNRPLQPLNGRAVVRYSNG